MYLLEHLLSIENQKLLHNKARFRMRGFVISLILLLPMHLLAQNQNNEDIPQDTIVTVGKIYITGYKKTRIEISKLENTLHINKSWLFSNVKASVPSKFILFKRKKGAIHYAIEIADRTTTFSEKYELPDFDDGYDYFCGAIDKKRESTLIEL